VRRGRWLKALAVAAGILAAVAGGWYFGVKLPAERRVAEQSREITETLPRELQAERDRVLAVSKVEEAKQRARALAADGEAALKAGDAAATRQKLAQLTALREKLEQSYVLRIVAKPGQQSAVWRVPRLNPAGRNYYIIVEAVDGQGRPVAVDITSEEDNKTARVSTFGIRVDQRTFEQIRADKEDDGIIQNNRFGEKQAGSLEPRYNLPTPGGAILQW
jgi:hypothetical protein